MPWPHANAFSHEAINLLECGVKRSAPLFLTFARIANHLVLSRITSVWEERRGRFALPVQSKKLRGKIS